MLKKITLLAIMLLVTNIHAVKIVRIINSYHKSIKIFYAEKTDKKKSDQDWDADKFIIIPPKSDEPFHFNWPINAKIEVVYEDEDKNGKFTVNTTLTNCEGSLFTGMRRCVTSPQCVVGQWRQVKSYLFDYYSNNDQSVTLRIRRNGTIFLVS